VFPFSYVLEIKIEFCTELGVCKVISIPLNGFLLFESDLIQKLIVLPIDNSSESSEEENE
jgi:hypothetical protein